MAVDPTYDRALSRSDREVEAGRRVSRGIIEHDDPGIVSGNPTELISCLVLGAALSDDYFEAVMWI
jgi:hypothetical protein